MQKVFEKIIDRLRDNVYLCKLTNIHMARAFSMSIKIVQEEMKEYNNGWIPVSERLPEEYGDYLIIWTDIIGTRFYEICEYEPNEGWIGDIPQAFNGKYSVIAWQPLPEMYKGV